jgi:hypothetical protein
MDYFDVNITLLVQLDIWLEECVKKEGCYFKCLFWLCNGWFIVLELKGWPQTSNSLSRVLEKWLIDVVRGPLGLEERKELTK